MLVVDSLSVSFSRYRSGLKKLKVRVIDSLDLRVTPGQLMAVVGQSGSGKSLLAHALLGILPRNASVDGVMLFKGQRLTPERQATLRGREISLIPQAVTYLNPLLRVGVQVARAARLSGVTSENVSQAVSQALERYLLHTEVNARFPFQLSGGMVRRVLTATATVGMADLIVADEPTNGLDPDTAGETLLHLRELADCGKGVLLITHDIDSALRVADMVTVFRAGTTVEVAAAGDFHAKGKLRHPYTRALWDALPANSFIKAAPPVVDPDSGGCPFRLCCGKQDRLCAERAPGLRSVDRGWVRCHHA